MDSSNSYYYQDPQFSANSLYPYTSLSTRSTIMSVGNFYDHVASSKLDELIANARNKKDEAEGDLTTTGEDLEKHSNDKAALSLHKNAQLELNTASCDLEYFEAVKRLRNLKGKAGKPDAFVEFVMKNAQEAVEQYEKLVSEETRSSLSPKSAGGGGKGSKTTKKD